MERDYGYQYGTAARKEPDDGIEVPYFVTPEYQRLKREKELRRQQLEREYYQRELAERERQRRERYKKTGHHIHETARQNNHKNERANTAKRNNKLRKFVIEMAALLLITTSVAVGINAGANAEKVPEDNEIKIEYNADVDTGINSEIPVDFSELYPEEAQKAEEIIHHYEAEDLDRENLSADQFCDNLDNFLDSNEALIGDSLEEKTWNLLYNQIGCSGEQSAAILGNMLVEDPSLNPFQHQVFSDMPDQSNDAIVKNGLGVGPFQFSGERKKAFLKFVQNHAEYSDLYSKFTSPKKYGATTQTALFDSDLSRYNLTEEDCDRGLKCVFTYISYEMQYPDDAHYNRNMWNKFIADEDGDKSATDLAIQFAQFFERSDSGYERRASTADEIYSKYLTFRPT